jgi:elongin-C
MSDRVSLISSEGYEFNVDERVARVSGLLRGKLDSKKGKDKRIVLSAVSASLLELMVQYFYYRTRYTECAGSIPAFPIAPELALEMLLVSNYFRC